MLKILYHLDRDLLLDDPESWWCSADFWSTGSDHCVPLCYKQHTSSLQCHGRLQTGSGRWLIKNAELKFWYLEPKQEKGKEKSTDSATVVVVCSGFVAAVIVFHRNSSKAARASSSLFSNPVKRSPTGSRGRTGCSTKHFGSAKEKVWWQDKENRLMEKREKGESAIRNAEYLCTKSSRSPKQREQKRHRNWLHKRAWWEAEEKVEVDGAAVVADGSR